MACPILYPCPTRALQTPCSRTRTPHGCAGVSARFRRASAGTASPSSPCWRRRRWRNAAPWRTSRPQTACFGPLPNLIPLHHPPRRDDRLARCRALGPLRRHLCPVRRCRPVMTQCLICLVGLLPVHPVFSQASGRALSHAPSAPPRPVPAHLAPLTIAPLALPPPLVEKRPAIRDAIIKGVEDGSSRMIWLPSAGPIVIDDLKLSTLFLIHYKRMRHAPACMLAHGQVGGLFCLCSAPQHSARER